MRRLDRRLDWGWVGRVPARAKARVLSPIVRRLSYLLGLSTLLAGRQRAARILMLHAVGGPTHRPVHRHLLDLYPTRVFEAELRYLVRRFSIVPLDRVIERLRRGEPSSGREIALTFDDGLRNTVTTAYPLFRRLGLPVTFFVCPGLIGTGRWQWSYEVPVRLARLAAAERKDLAHRMMAPSATIEGILEWMKTLDAPGRMRAEGYVENATPGFRPTPEESYVFDVMSWQELASLDPELVTVGSHSLTHPVLSTLASDSLAKEIVGSRRLLEEKLSRPVELFCYPDGRHSEAVVDLARQHYRAAVTTRAALVSTGDDLHLLPRIGAGEERAHDLAWRLHRPRA